MITKPEAFKHRKAVSFKSVFVPILTYDPDSWVVTEIILSQGQAAKMGFLRRAHGVTLPDKVRSCEIRGALKVELFPSELREHRCIGSAMCPECPTKDWRGKSSWTELSEIPVDREVFHVLLRLQHPRPSLGKTGTKMNEMNNIHVIWFLA